MEWYIYAFIGSFLWSLAFVIEKKVLFKEHSMEYSITRTFFMMLLVLLLLPFFDMRISLQTALLIYIASLMAAMGIVYRVRAARHLDISIVSPFMNFDPVLVIILSFIFLRDTITYQQLAGVFIIVVGAYMLEADGSIKNLMKPVRVAMSSKYIHYIFLAIFFFSIDAVVSKYVLTFYTPVFTYLFYFWIFVFSNFFLISLFRYDGVGQIKKGLADSGFWIFVVSLMVFAASFSMFQALSLGNVSLVVTIKRFGTVFTTILGGELFHEKHLKVRVLSSLVMFVGVYLILM